MKKVLLLLLLVLFGCSKDNRDNSQGDIPQDTIVSAFFGLDNVLPGLLCNQPGSQLDGMPVNFKFPLDVSSLSETDFEVVDRLGNIHTPNCVSLAPANENGENRSVLLLGEFGTAVTNPPVEVRVTGDLFTTDTISGESACSEIINLNGITTTNVISLDGTNVDFNGSADEFTAIADGLERLPQLAARLNGGLDDRHPEWLRNLCTPDPALAELAQAVRHALIDTPPLSLSEGGLIHDGVDPLLDGLRNQLDDQNAWLAEQERLERERSGNNNLRLQYHRTFGYFLAVSKAKASSVPDHWIRRQTLANEERFITPELKEREGRIFQLRARACQREYEFFCGLREQVGAMAAPIRQAARAIASLDALTSLAESAATGGWCAPVLSDNRQLEIRAGRHPVVEQLLVESAFTPNDLTLGNGTDLIVLTGPNASGKSCYLRQIGVIQLLAQIGSWVPAAKARIGIADRIFTRVGAVDDLAAGQSTFMVEMAETANILQHASERSLVLLDEIGRGTATFDGLSIAWAVAEHLASAPPHGLGARSIFATHYHELNNLAAKRANVANFQVLVEETGDDLVFLHRVQSGGASRSYGIEAARLAGVPTPVVQRARQVLDQLAA